MRENLNKWRNSENRDVWHSFLKQSGLEVHWLCPHFYKAHYCLCSTDLPAESVATSMFSLLNHSACRVVKRLCMIRCVPFYIILCYCDCSYCICVLVALQSFHTSYLFHSWYEIIENICWFLLFLGLYMNIFWILILSWIISQYEHFTFFTFPCESITWEFWYDLSYNLLYVYSDCHGKSRVGGKN